MADVIRTKAALQALLANYQSPTTISAQSIRDLVVSCMNGGTQATVADGGTIAHGCGATPTVVNVTASVTGEFASITGLDATNITVAIKKHDNSAGTTQTIYWSAF